MRGVAAPNAFPATWGWRSCDWAVGVACRSSRSSEALPAGAVIERGRESGRARERREGEERVGWVVDFYVCAVCFAVVSWEWSGREGEKGEKRGRRWIGALRRLVSKLVCQVFHVSCVEDEVLRWRVFFWQEICGKPFNLACRPCAFSFLLFFSLYAFPLFSHWGEFGGWALPLPPHSTSLLLFFPPSPSHCVLSSGACMDNQSAIIGQRVDQSGWPLSLF